VKECRLLAVSASTLMALGRHRHRSTDKTLAPRTVGDIEHADVPAIGERKGPARLESLTLKS
jgi:hypothetical protein